MATELTTNDYGALTAEDDNVFRLTLKPQVQHYPPPNGQPTISDLVQPVRAAKEAGKNPLLVVDLRNIDVANGGVITAILSAKKAADTGSRTMIVNANDAVRETLQATRTDVYRSDLATVNDRGNGVFVVTIGKEILGEDEARKLKQILMGIANAQQEKGSKPRIIMDLSAMQFMESANNLTFMQVNDALKKSGATPITIVGTGNVIHVRPGSNQLYDMHLMQFGEDGLDIRVKGTTAEQVVADPNAGLSTSRRKELLKNGPQSPAERGRNNSAGGDWAQLN